MPMDKFPKVYVIVVTYKGREWYDRCFLSFRKSTIPVEVVAVDNTPGDEDANYICTHFPEVHMIKPSINIGFGRANNIGMRYALDKGCDYVFLLNQDAWIKSDTLKILIEVALTNTEYGILSPMHIRKDEKSLYIQIEDGSMDHGNTLLADCYFQNLQDVYPFLYINAAAWLISRKVLETIGGFDPIFFLYGEDDNYLQRMYYHKQKVGLVPKSVIIHDHITTSREEKAETLSYREKQILLVKYTNINVPFHYVRNCLYLFRQIVLNMFRSRKKQKLQAELVFLIKNETAIRNSRKQNVLMEKNWL